MKALQPIKKVTYLKVDSRKKIQVPMYCLVEIVKEYPLSGLVRVISPIGSIMDYGGSHDSCYIVKGRYWMDLLASKDYRTIENFKPTEIK